jgi:hypothetical protein
VPFASTLELVSPLPAGVEGSVWLSTGPDSTAVDGLRHIRPDAFQVPSPGEHAGPFPVAIALTGRFSSFFADRPIPPAPAGADGSHVTDDPTEKILDGDQSRLVVVSSADFIANNLPFVLNTVDWMVQDSALIAIRSRVAGVDALPPFEGSSAWKAKAAITGVPLLVLLAVGGAIFLRGRRGAS